MVRSAVQTGGLTVLLATLMLAQTCNFVFVPLPAPLDAPDVYYHGMTDSGLVMGFAGLRQYTYSIQECCLQAVVRSNGVSLLFTDPAGGSVAFLGGNNRGKLVGYTYSDNYKAFTNGLFDWVFPGMHGIIRSSDQLHSFDYSSATGTRLQGINDNGDMVGTYCEGPGALNNAYNGSQHAFKVIGGVPSRVFQMEPGDASFALGINNAGQILGYVHIPATKSVRDFVSPFLIDPDGTYKLINPPWFTSQTYGTGINDAGDVVGYSWQDGTIPHGFLLHNGHLEMFDAPGAGQGAGGGYTGYPGTEVYAINNGGQIVGRGGSVNNFVTSCQPPVPKTIAAVGGGSQTVVVGKTALPLIARVTDAAGYGAHGVKVSFAVTSGAGVLSAASGVTEADGTVNTVFAAPTTPGTVTVTATVPGLPPLAFTEFVVPVIVGAPSGLSFAYTLGGAPAPSQSFSFSTNPAGLTVTSVTATTNGGNWLSAVASGGTVTVSVKTAGLGVGTYNGTITLSAAAASPPNTAVVPVTLTVSSPSVAITGVANAASGTAGIQSGSWVSVFGTNLSATTRMWQNSDFSGNNLPRALDGVSVNINGKSAAVYYISPGQLNVQAPTDAVTGPVQVQVSNSYGVAMGTATLQPYAPGFFTQQGKYAAAVGVDGVYIAPTGFYGATAASRPAHPGEVLLIYGTGFGPTTPAIPAGQIFSGAAPLKDPSQLQITVGGVPATVQFAGIVASGEYQLNVVVPAVPDGDQAIIATIGGASTQDGLLISVKN